MSPPARNKATINASVSPYLKKQVVDLVESGEFSSMSDVVEQALNKFIPQLKQPGYQAVHVEPSVRGEAVEEYPDKDIWKQKGITYREMGRLEEALECFDMALGLCEISKPAKAKKPTTTREIILE